jgi:flagellar basal-body rod protein FlgF
MIKGIFSSEASMRPKMAKLEVIANNLANINSTGFKKDLLFMQMLKDSASAQASGKGELDGLKINRATDFSDGVLNQTGNTFDLALQGRGFFVAETPQGMRYTRNGNFKLSADGVLTTADGYPVMGAGGRIQLPQKERMQQGVITVTDTGEIVLNKEIIAKLRIADFEDLGTLKKDQKSFFAASGAERILEGADTTTYVKQGFLEGSNVEGIEEMIAMVELTRGFETDQKIITAQDSTIEKSLEVGRV